MNGILLSWTIPTHLVMGSLLGPMSLMRDMPLILIFNECWDYTRRAIQTLSILDDSSSTLTPCPTLMTNQRALKPINMMSVLRPLTMKNSGHILVGSMWTLFRKPWNTLPNWGVSLPNTFPMK